MQSSSPSLEVLGNLAASALSISSKRCRSSPANAVFWLSCRWTSYSTRLCFLVCYATSFTRLSQIRSISIFKSRSNSVALVRCGAGGAFGVRCSAQSGRAGQRRGSELRPWPRHFGDPEPGYFLPDCNRDPGSWLPQYLSLGKGATCMRPYQMRAL